MNIQKVFLAIIVFCLALIKVQAQDDSGSGDEWLRPHTNNLLSYHLGAGYPFRAGIKPDKADYGISSGVVFYLGSGKPNGGLVGMGINYDSKTRFVIKDSMEMKQTISVPTMDGTLEFAIPNYANLFLAGTAIIFAAGVPLEDRHLYIAHAYAGFRCNVNFPSVPVWSGNIITFGVYAEGGGSFLFLQNHKDAVTANFRVGIIMNAPWSESNEKRKFD